MRKDRLILQKLNNYAEACRPPSGSMLNLARAEFAAQKAAARPFSEKVQSGVKFKSKPLFKLTAGMAAAVVFIFSLVYMMSILPLKGTTPPQGDNEPQQQISYSLSQLSGTPTEPQLLRDAEGSPLLTAAGLEGGSFTVTAFEFYHKDKEQPVTAWQQYKVLTSSGMDEVLLIADMGGGLKDYQQVKNSVTVYRHDGIEMYGTVDMYINGEFYTALYFNYSGTDYYLIIMSPSNYSYQSFLPLLTWETAV